MSNLIKYKGSCHCGAVKYEALAPRELTICDCNCSVCTKKQDRHFVVPVENFKLISGESSLATYTFGTHQAKHTFCSICGVQSFYTPRSSSKKRAIMPHCVDSPLPLKIKIEKFDGQNWEEAMKREKEVSKPE